MIHGLALCSGIGGLELGLRLAIGDSYRTVCYVEREGFLAGILAARMADGLLDEAPVWDDLESFDGRPWRGRVHVVTAGFPCQPWSVAGARRGAEDDRWLWPAIARVIREVGPGLVFLENVPGLLAGGLGYVLSDLAALGFDAEWGVFGADDVGAPHRRKRVFVLAYTPELQLAGLERADGDAARLPVVEVADAGCLRDGPDESLPVAGGRDQADAGDEVERLGDADESRPDSGTPPGRSRPATRESGGLLGDTDAAGLEVGRPAEPRGFPGPFPPGPGDRDSWADILERDPDLAPATAQPRIRHLAHGLAKRPHDAVESPHETEHSEEAGAAGDTGAVLSEVRQTARPSGAPPRGLRQAAGRYGSLPAVPPRGGPEARAIRGSQAAPLQDLREDVQAGARQAAYALWLVTMSSALREIERGEAMGWQGQDALLRQLWSKLHREEAAREDLRSILRARSRLAGAPNALTRMDQLRALGNSVIPLVAATAFLHLARRAGI